MTWETWKTEAAMVADFTAWVGRAGGWTAYAETAGWDLLLVRDADGFQIGIEAKLSLNAAVLCQVIGHDSVWAPGVGPDCHAVLVPRAKSVNGLATIAKRIGVVVITGHEPPSYRGGGHPAFGPELPTTADRWAMRDDVAQQAWPEHFPEARCKLPEYVPDVTGGHSAPVQLTIWKIAALKIAVLLEVRGHVTRADFKALGIDARRWTDSWLKSNGEGGWVAANMPDFRRQHPVNYEQIKADLPKWGAAIAGLQLSGVAA